MVDDWLLEGVDVFSCSHRRCQYWCRANKSQVRQASLDLGGLLALFMLLEESVQLH